METKPKSYDCFSCNKPHSAQFPTMVCDMCALDFATCFNKLSVIQELSEIAYLTKNYPVLYKDVRESYIYVKLRKPEIEPKALYAIVYFAVQNSIKEASTPFIEVSKDMYEITLKRIENYEENLKKTKEWLKSFTALQTISVKANFNGFDLPLM